MDSTDRRNGHRVTGLLISFLDSNKIKLQRAVGF